MVRAPILSHGLRHSCASFLVSSGIPMKRGQLFPGHSNYSTKADIYAHLSPNALDACGAKAACTIHAEVGEPACCGCRSSGSTACSAPGRSRASRWARTCGPAKEKTNIYTGMLLKGTLKEHVETIDRDAQDLYETIVRNQARHYGVNEELKARDQMEWVRWMNAIRLVAEEVVIKEVLQL